MLRETRENGWVVLKPQTEEEQVLSVFERRVCSHILGTHSEWSVARNQIDSARVVDRTLTGVGSFTNLEIRTEEVDPSITTGIGQNVTVRCDSCPAGATALFLCGGGQLRALELAAFPDWSADDVAETLLGDDSRIEFMVERGRS